MRTTLRRGFLTDELESHEGKPPAPDRAVLGVIEHVLASGVVGERTEAEQQCCELGALHRLAAEIRSRT